MESLLQLTDKSYLCEAMVIIGTAHSVYPIMYKTLYSTSPHKSIIFILSNLEQIVANSNC